MQAFIEPLIRAYEVNRTQASLNRLVSLSCHFLCEETVLKKLAESVMSSTRFDDRDLYMHFDFGYVNNGE